ncbi:MAG: hypothetical protein HY875_17720 [Chloroflexi bacterium]|nr:hypothetical protein [Chloroflexota bacterium]
MTIQANLAAARDGRFPHNEETVTENLILWANQGGLPSVQVHALTKPKEAKLGYDFDLRLETQPGSFKSILTQAKRETANGAYRVDYAVGTNTQLGLLKDHVKATRSSGAYMFYNASLRPGFVAAHCPCSGLGCGSGVSADDCLIGCTVTPLDDVEAVLNRDGRCGLKNVHDCPNTIPLRCLLCPRRGWAGPLAMAAGADGTAPWEGILAESPPRAEPGLILERLRSANGAWREDYPTGFIPKYLVVIRAPL